MICPVQFTLVVNDFGVKYVGEENSKHLIKVIESKGYRLGDGWTNTRYYGITQNWNYDERTLVISMPGYVQNMLVRLNEIPKSDINLPYQSKPRKFGKS